jgi:hypothetical protein
MSDEITADKLRQELTDIDAEIAELRRVGGDAEARRGQDTDTSQGVIEPEEIATELTGMNENDAVIDVLNQRRERVEAQLKSLS